MPQHSAQNSQTRTALVLSALYGGLRNIVVNVVGQLMLAEVLALVCLPTINISRLLARCAELRTAMLGFATLLFFLIVSDVYNATPIIDSLRGWASIVFGAASTLFLVSLFMKNANAIYAFLLGMAASAAVFGQGELSFDVIESDTNYFKARFVPVFMPLILVACTFLWRKSRPATILLLGSSSIVFLVFDARSWGMIFFLSALLLSARTANLRARARTVALVSLLVSVVAYGGYAYYVGQVLDGRIGGTNARQVMRLENPYNPFELLGEGRAEAVVSIVAIKDRPVIGYGSWARDPTGEYTMLLADRKDALGQLATFNELGLIPGHSLLLTSWLWAGVGGLVGALLILWSVVRAFARSFWRDSPLTPLVCAIFIQAVWDALFSPLGGLRTTFPYEIAILVAAAYAAQPLRRTAPTTSEPRLRMT